MQRQSVLLAIVGCCRGSAAQRGCQVEAMVCDGVTTHTGYSSLALAGARGNPGAAAGGPPADGRPDLRAARAAGRVARAGAIRQVRLLHQHPRGMSCAGFRTLTLNPNPSHYSGCNPDESPFHNLLMARSPGFGSIDHVKPAVGLLERGVCLTALPAVFACQYSLPMRMAGMFVPLFMPDPSQPQIDVRSARAWAQTGRCDSWS